MFAGVSNMRTLSGNKTSEGEGLERRSSKRIEGRSSTGRNSPTPSADWTVSEVQGDSLTPEEASQHVTIWNRVECRKIAGNAAPLRRNLERYLAKHLECEVYCGQDKNMHGGIGTIDPKTGSTIVAGNEHVPMWNKIEERKITGNAAPLRKNVGVYLAKHPECEIYVGQDKDPSLLSVVSRRETNMNKDVVSNTSNVSGESCFLEPRKHMQDSYITAEESEVTAAPEQHSNFVVNADKMDPVLSQETVSMSLDNSHGGFMEDVGYQAGFDGRGEGRNVQNMPGESSPLWNDTLALCTSNMQQNSCYSTSWSRPSFISSGNIYGYSPNTSYLPHIQGRAVPIPGRDHPGINSGLSNNGGLGMEDFSWSSTFLMGSYGAGSGLTPLASSLEMDITSESMSPSTFLLSGQSPANTAVSSGLRHVPFKGIGPYGGYYNNNECNPTNHSALSGGAPRTLRQ